MRTFRCNFAKFFRGHAQGPQKMGVPLALPLKLICDVTRLWRNFGQSLENFLRTPLSTRKPSRFLLCTVFQDWKTLTLDTKNGCCQIWVMLHLQQDLRMT